MNDEKPESDVCADIVEYAEARPDMQLWRNNTGMMKGRIRFGLCKGSSDYIGYVQVKITPAMVGKTVAVFTAVEAKRVGGVPTTEQEEFVDSVASSGGIAFFADSVDVVVKRIRGYMLKLKRRTGK